MEPRDVLLSIATSYGDQMVRVSTKDTGSGISAKVLPTLFEPFHNSTTSGMGIGLSLCRSIVEAHGGKIWAETGGPETEFVFTLKADG